MDPLVYKLIWIFGWVLVILVVWLVRGLRRQRRVEMIHAERMAALDKGVPLPELPGYEDSPRSGLHPPNPRTVLGLGVTIAMLGIGVCLALLLSGDAYHNEIWPFGLIGVFLGVGLVLHYWLTYELVRARGR
jgi:hypothetical protein